MAFGRITAKSPLEDRQAAQRVKTNENAQAMLNFAVSRYQDGWRDLWANPLGLTPQQVCDQWGTNAVLFMTGAGLFMEAAAAGLKAQGMSDEDIAATLKPAPKKFTPNPDGTITIGE